MSRWGQIRTLDMWGLRKGYFSDRHPMEIPEGGAYDSMNVVGVNGQLRPRPGAAAIYTDSATVGGTLMATQPVRHLGEYVNFDNVRRLMCMRAPLTDNSTAVAIRQHDGTSWSTVFSNSTPAGSGIGLPGRIPASSANFKGEWFVNQFFNDDDVYVWDGSALTSLSNGITAQLRGPKGSKFIAAHPDRLILTNVRDRSNVRRAYRVVWSAKLQARIYRNENSSNVGSGTAGYVDLADKSDPITAIYASGDVILVFRARSVYQGDFVGSPLMYRFRRLSEGSGCISHASLCEYRDGALVWLGDDNVYFGSPGQVPRSVGNPIQAAIRARCDLSLLERAVGVVDQDYHLYHLFLPNNTNGKVDVVFTLNLEDFSWWPGSLAASGIDVRCAFAYRKGVWDSEILLGDNAGGIYDFSFDNVGDKGVVFPAYWQSGLLSVDRYFQGIEQASIQQLRAYASSGSIQLSLISGDGLDRFSTTNFGTQVFSGSANSIDVSARPPKAEHAMVKATWVDGATRISGLSVGVIPEGASRGKR